MKGRQCKKGSVCSVCRPEGVVEELYLESYRVYTTMVRHGTAQHGTVRNGYRATAFTRVCGYVV